MNAAPLLASLANRQGVVLRSTTATWGAATVLDEVAVLSGLVNDCRVLAVLADNSLEWVIADLAALHSGCVHLPLPAFFTNQQLAHALEQAGSDGMLTDQPARIEALGLGFATLATWRGLAWMRRQCPAVAMPAGTAKISFTSGSTGAPRGVCLSLEGLLQAAAALVTTLADLPIARHLSVLPLALLLENLAGVYAPLLRGTEIVLPSLQELGWRGMAGFDAGALRRALARYQPDSAILVPELLKALLADAEPFPESLRFVAVGGARCTADLIESARRRGLPVYEGYGLTECGSVVCLNYPGADQTGTVGRPLPHVRLEVDAAHEVRISSAAFLGYLGDAVAVTHPSFATGDLGHIDPAGFLHLNGRRKNLLITAYGRNVAPEWVEAALTAQPEILQAVVYGDARPWLAAVLVPMPGTSGNALSRAVVRANLGLPDYARVEAWTTSAPFTAGNGLATGNNRPIRTAIASHHGEAIAALYD